MIYLGAGSLGLRAMQDGLELPGAFDVGAAKNPALSPRTASACLSTARRDDSNAAEEGIDALAVGPADLAIAVSTRAVTTLRKFSSA